MKVSFVFPGQGSQTVGMLDSVAEDAVVKSVLERASAALEQDIGSLIAHGPSEKLALTINTQPAMLVAGYALFALWRARGGALPAVVAGHSLGEYTALTVAGALRLEDAVSLVRFRAQAMQRAVPAGIGAMAAILGLADDDVIAACSEAASAIEKVEAVNFNAPSQVVIAGHLSAVERACEGAKRRGAKRAVLLPVSAPFHSTLMSPAAEALRERLASVEISTPLVPLINNIDVEAVYEPDQIRDALVRQAAGPVRWAQIIRRMGDLGVSHVIECGPGKVLSGLTRRIDDRMHSGLICDAATLHASLESLKGMT